MNVHDIPRPMYTISYASPANAPFAMYTIPPLAEEAGELNLLGYLGLGADGSLS